MNTRHALLTCCTLGLAAAAAHAQPGSSVDGAPRAIEGYYPELADAPSVDRAEIVADVMRARSAGQLGFDHAGDLAAYPEGEGSAPATVRFASDGPTAN